LKLNGTHQLLAFADDVNTLGGKMNTIKRRLSKCFCLSMKIQEKNHDLLIVDTSFGNMGISNVWKQQ
jgi:hypothetical protein